MFKQFLLTRDYIRSWRYNNKQEPWLIKFKWKVRNHNNDIRFFVGDLGQLLNWAPKPKLGLRQANWQRAEDTRGGLWSLRKKQQHVDKGKNSPTLAWTSPAVLTFPCFFYLKPFLSSNTRQRIMNSHITINELLAYRILTCSIYPIPTMNYFEISPQYPIITSVKISTSISKE